ncbi:MAG: replicative DNA helicase [Thermoanaerobaculia bacterium]|nr:replicative DNA helicase [Thermoanaerobaculia bacterium]
MLQEVTADKGLPQNMEAERSVLGAILLDPASLTFAVPILREEDFFPDTHRRIYRAMLDLFQRSSEIDVLTVKEELDRVGAVEKVGGAAYLSALLDAVPDVANVETYARIVKEKSTLRRLIQAGQRMVREGISQEKTAEQLLGDSTGEIFGIADDSVREVFTPIGKIVKHNLELIEDARNRQGMLSGLATGFTELDRLTSGLQTTDLILLAARPAVGKTSLALNVAQHVSVREARSVGFFSLEMSKEQIGFRVLCSEADVDAKKVRDGYASKEAIGRLVLAQTKIAGASFFIDDAPGLSVPIMRAKAQRLKREKGLDLIVVDYLQLMAGHGRFDNRVQEVSQISRGLKLLAKELAVPILALSQLSRQPEARKGDQRKPQLSDLRESGCLTADTRILRTDGSQTTMGELHETGERDISVWTLNDSMQLVPGRMTHVFASGVKPVFALLLASGRRVTASANHPFLTARGWRPLEDLAVGEPLAVAPRSPQGATRRARPRLSSGKGQAVGIRLDHPRRQAEPGVARGFAVAFASAFAGAVMGVLSDAEVLAASPDVLWDPIVRIERRGEEPVFDATVPGTHNFVAEGVVAHNSLEQDADVVIFLYREELYERDTERKGIADVLVAKQRNGPTGEFPLVFLADHMTFANYAGPAVVQDQPF